MMIRRSVCLAAAIAAIFGCASPTPRAADTIPSRYTDTQFWQLITDLSEPDAPFPYENFVSNELSYQSVLPELTQTAKPGGVYIGVATEQNFTYAAALQPRIALVVDIRRQNMIELLMYKALFDLSSDRADFVAKLFSRKRPAVLTVNSSAESLFRAFDPVVPDAALFRQTLQAIKDNLVTQHQFKLSNDDQAKIEYIFNAFFKGGPKMDYTYASASPASGVPSYTNLMTATDGHGKNWAYLDNEDRYRFVREMQQKNLIVPVVGDFAGPKTIKAIGKYLKDHAATVSVFYISNVEDYLQSNWNQYRSNLAALPTDPLSKFIRFWPRTTLLRPMSDVPPAWPGRNW